MAASLKDSRNSVLTGIRSKRHVVIAAPSGHGKTTLLSELSSDLRASKDFVVDDAYGIESWAGVWARATSFAQRRLPQDQRTRDKVFVIDDVDSYAACDRGCVSGLKALLKDHVGRVSFVLASDRDFASKLERARRDIIRVDLFPVSEACLNAYGIEFLGTDCQEMVRKLVRTAQGSFPTFSRLLRESKGGVGTLETSTSPTDVSLQTLQGAVCTLLGPNGASMSLDAVDSYVTAFGSHMFVDTLFDNAPMALPRDRPGVSFGEFTALATSYVLAHPTRQGTCALDCNTRAGVNLFRACILRAAWRAGASVRTGDVMFTGSLAQCNARASARKRIRDLATESSVTSAELAWGESFDARVNRTQPGRRRAQ